LTQAAGIRIASDLEVRELALRDEAERRAVGDLQEKAF
jgi:hypothetical protein